MTAKFNPDQSKRVYRDRWGGERFIVESRDEHYVYGRRESNKDGGDFEPYSVRLSVLRGYYVACDDKEA